MARMTLSDLVDKVQDWIPEFAESKVKNIANLLLGEFNLLDYGFTKYIGTITTTDNVTSGITASVSKGSTSVTIDGGTWPTTYDGQRVRFPNSDAWYEISDTVADTSFSISSAYDGDDESASTIEVAFPRIQLPDEVVQVDVVARPKKRPLKVLTREIPPHFAVETKVREPSCYYEVEPENTDDNIELMLLDFPDDAYTYYVVGKKRLTKFTSSSSKSGWPEKYEHALVSGVLAAVLDIERGTEQSAWWTRRHVAQMREIKRRKDTGYRNKVGTFVSSGTVPRYYEPDEVS